MKTHDVDDPGDDQGKPPEEGHGAEEPHDQTANEHHGAIAAVPESLFVFDHVIGPSADGEACLNRDDQCLAVKTPGRCRWCPGMTVHV
jgi:hypothetical protein